MTNKEISTIFYEMADILEIKEVKWKPQAYRKAARAIEVIPENLSDIYKKGGLKTLEEIPGIGEGIGKKIVEYIETGKIKKHQELLKSLPKGFQKLMEVQGLGPKKVKILLKKKNIKNIGDLEKALKQHKLIGLKGFAEKTEENLEKGIQLFKSGKKRFDYSEVRPIAESIAKQLKKFKEVRKIIVAGSFRRKEITVGDLDVLMTAKNPIKVMDYFTKMPNVKRVLAKGKTRSAVILDSNLQVDVRVVEDKCFGAALQYFTGNKMHNISLRKIAIKKGFKLNEYGVFDKKTNQFLAGKTEEDVYNALGLKYIPPEERTNSGEIEKAMKK
ncbi:MAG: helix-hairpin-helix domain-containing protein [Nanoarchaeota archaeon]|nr:helix-hairpin-helix domain-containing protein [Nanoarchaeota archaeon]